MRIRIFALSLFFCAAAAWTQETPVAAPSAGDSGLPRDFFGVSLSGGLQPVKDRLASHPYFLYRGDPDLSFVPHTTRTVIDCEGRSFVNRGLFQFSDERLYIITLYLNPERMDYFSLFAALTKKYGRPVSIDPSAAVWQNNETRLSLEKPLTFKYIDRGTFDKLKAEGETQKSREEQSRQQFLDSF